MVAVSRKSPFWLPNPNEYKNNHLLDSHSSALYALGEYVMFALMWRATDLKAGLVGRCPTCYAPAGEPEPRQRTRVSEAYKQAADSKCLDCFGTTLEGGYRALVVRPALISDKSTDTKTDKRGEISTDSLTLETTTDFYCHSGDYLIRGDGKRYRLQEMSTLVVRSGFNIPEQRMSVGGMIPGARLEDPSSVAYLIPPESSEANALLMELSLNRHIPRDETEYDVLRPNGYLIP